MKAEELIELLKGAENFEVKIRRGGQPYYDKLILTSEDE